MFLVLLNGNEVKVDHLIEVQVRVLVLVLVKVKVMIVK